jgi:glycosyltransferase involved in cell wall biosynthesis
MLSDMETQGGAGIAASWLADGLAQAGSRITRIVETPDGEQHSWKTLTVSRNAAFVQRVARKFLPILRESINSSTMSFALETLLDKLQPDLISIHNIHGSGWPLEFVRACARRVPTVWTLHDMWAITGRCVYSFDCNRYINGCDAKCPSPNEYPALTPNRIHEAWIEKRNLVDEIRNLVGVAPSIWLVNAGKSGIWKNRRLEHIPNGIPQDVFRPIERRIARTALGLACEGRVMIAAADNLLERRKGGELLQGAIARLKTKSLTLITIGNTALKMPTAGINYVHLGHIASERLRALVFNSGDFLVHPAPVDNMPLVVLESLACGVPVVGFSVGGIPEMVRTNQTGWLAPQVCAESLATTIDAAFDFIANNRDLRTQCRAVAEAEYSVSMYNDRYEKLFQSIL